MKKIRTIISWEFKACYAFQAPAKTKQDKKKNQTQTRRVYQSIEQPNLSNIWTNKIKSKERIHWFDVVQSIFVVIDLRTSMKRASFHHRFIHFRIEGYMFTAPIFNSNSFIQVCCKKKLIPRPFHSLQIIENSSHNPLN